MGSVTQITQFLYQQDPRSKLGQLCLYHYLKNSVDLSRPFDDKLVADFFRDCLRFQQWRQDFLVLKSEISQFAESAIQAGLSEAELMVGIPQTSMQQIDFENTQDFEGLLIEQLASKSNVKDVHIFDHGVGDKLVLQLLQSGGLLAEVYQPRALIENGQLELLAPETSLEYDSKMELVEKKKQRLALNKLQTLCFQRISPKFYGRTLQGHLYQSVGQFETDHISSHKEAFMRLKEIERHFIEPTSDPYYQELVDALEKTYHQLHNGNREAFDFAPRALNKGREALQTIYPKDKLLLLLVTNIEYLLRPRKKPVNSGQKSQENSSWQKIKPLPM